ncbi:hypothetical protein GX51_07705 [Blastomyces parvus]|uniref:Uncharacterized protein n=1 Tax=Blastomyces parvus TaxID=2060905 RepID=A0A2B7WIU2_9EURO|nr:hypothetical protein GX51_07705 [Blastomyces parvus]
MKLQALLSLCFISAVTVPAVAVQTNHENHADVVRRLKGHSEGLGFKHVGDDGVARSFSLDGKVLDAAPLTNAQLLMAAQKHPDPSARKHLIELWKDVDGHNAPLEHYYSPPEELLPLFPSDSEVKRKLEAKKKQSMYEKRSNVLSHPLCETIVCDTALWCAIHECSDCVYYDRLKDHFCTQ